MQEKLFYLNSAGEKLCAVLSNPDSGFIKPIIILCHGFGSSKESKSITALEKLLNEKGVSTFKIDLYAHGESEGNFSDLTISEAVDDILRAISLLKSKGYKKIGLMGSSFGGNAAVIAASRTHELFCLALRSPVSDYPEILQKEWGEAGLLKWKHEGVSQKNGHELKYSFVMDAQNNVAFDVANKITVPTLIVHGDKDETVPIEQSKKLASLLPGSRLEVITGADHRYSTPAHFNKMVEVIADFLKSNN